MDCVVFDDGAGYCVFCGDFSSICGGSCMRSLFDKDQDLSYGQDDSDEGFYKGYLNSDLLDSDLWYSD